MICKTSTKNYSLVHNKKIKREDNENSTYVFKSTWSILPYLLFSFGLHNCILVKPYPIEAQFLYKHSDTSLSISQSFTRLLRPNFLIPTNLLLYFTVWSIISYNQRTLSLISTSKSHCIYCLQRRIRTGGDPNFVQFRTDRLTILLGRYCINVFLNSSEDPLFRRSLFSVSPFGTTELFSTSSFPFI